MKITAVIITKNEEANMKPCLDSLQDVADEIIVIDSLSTDKTEAICRSYPNLVFVSRTWAGYSATKNYGNNLAQHPYILSIDADEVLSEKLRLEIIKMKPVLRGGYQMPRLNHIGKKAIKFSGWYPDTKLRLFPKAEAHWEGEFVHEKLVYKGEVHHFENDLLHFTYKNFAQFDKKMRNYATLSAKDMYSKGRHLSFGFMVLKFGFKFFSIFILKLGILDGLEGFEIALEASKTVMWKYEVLHQLYEDGVLA